MVLKANARRTSCPCHDEFRGPRSDYVRQVALATTTTTTTSHCSATRGLLVTDHVILNHGQLTWTIPELAPPLLTTTPMGGRFSSRQI
ncbi:hypothetical protein TNCV_616961 [Trichonephila clavipes]|nr:hypothetical protein TNCV_616961 [Trichonephila clavipes]